MAEKPDILYNDTVIERQEVMNMALLEVNNLKKIYTTRFGGTQVEALRNVNFSVEPREYVAINGRIRFGKRHC